MILDARRITLLTVLAWWTVLMVAVIAFRPLTPVDETRAAAVAWEMHLSGDWLVLKLNGELYGHKPPLLAWLINIGWSIFGVSDGWPRVLTGLFGLGGLGTVWALGRRLAPQSDELPMFATLIAGSSLGWMIFTGAVMYDLALTALVALAAFNVLRAAAGACGAWIWVGVAMGLGILTKGPVALLHVLPLALLGPWWLAERPAGSAGWGRWYRGVGLATVVGVAIALAWAVPTALVAGDDFRREIFWSQSVDRMVSTVQHAASIWYYVALLPLLWFPWTFVPSVWRGAVALIRSERILSVRFALAWLVPAFVAFSLFKAKLVYYMLPETPAFALLIAAGLLALRSDASRPDTSRAAWRVGTRGTAVVASGSAGIALVVAVSVVMATGTFAGLNVQPVARVLAGIERTGQPIAHHGYITASISLPADCSGHCTSSAAPTHSRRGPPAIPMPAWSSTAIALSNTRLRHRRRCRNSRDASFTCGAGSIWPAFPMPGSAGAMKKRLARAQSAP